MPASPLRWLSRAPGPKPEAQQPEVRRLHTVPEAFLAGELARLENSTEARIHTATEQIRELSEAAEARVSSQVEAALESSLTERLERKMDARLASLEELTGELRAEAQRLDRGLEAAGEAVVERAGALVFEQVRRADAAELERTRMARASLQGLGEEAERIRADAATEAGAQAARVDERLGALEERLRGDFERSQAEAAAELEATLTGRLEEAIEAFDERLVSMQARTAEVVESELLAVRERSDAEVRALAERAGVLVYERIRTADSRVEAAVTALAREIDAMRSALRGAAEPPQEPVPARLAEPPAAPPARWARLRRAFKLGR
ncbi:MAG: hypothetical protein ACR2G3_07695 [Solirubrobacterales bacterium]